MNEQEKIRQERQQSRQTYGALFDTVSEILFRHDPIHINFGFNTDEYEPEVVTILPRLKDCHTLTDVQAMVHGEFVHWFGADIAGAETVYTEIAKEIWKVKNAKT